MSPRKWQACNSRCLRGQGHGEQGPACPRLSTQPIFTSLGALGIQEPQVHYQGRSGDPRLQGVPSISPQQGGQLWEVRPQDLTAFWCFLQGYDPCTQSCRVQRES